MVATKKEAVGREAAHRASGARGGLAARGLGSTAGSVSASRGGAYSAPVSERIGCGGTPCFGLRGACKGASALVVPKKGVTMERDQLNGDCHGALRIEGRCNCAQKMR